MPQNLIYLVGVGSADALWFETDADAEVEFDVAIEDLFWVPLEVGGALDEVGWRGIEEPLLAGDFPELVLVCKRDTAERVAGDCPREFDRLLGPFYNY